MVEVIKPRTGDIVLTVGTRKGAFLLSSGPERKNWSLSGAHHQGNDVFHVTYDRRDGSVFAAINCRWSTIMSVVNRSGKMSVHERIDIDPERTGKAPSAQRYPGRSDISG